MADMIKWHQASWNNFHPIYCKSDSIFQNIFREVSQKMFKIKLGLGVGYSVAYKKKWVFHCGYGVLHYFIN